jgi:succinylglutamate desuccinylase
MAVNQTIPPAVRALAEADFSAVANSFTKAGFTIGQPADGILTIRSKQQGRPAILVSVGVHGDETGPIELVAYLLDALAQEPQAASRPDALRRQYRRHPPGQALHRR